jgi:hypothetical protein
MSLSPALYSIVVMLADDNSFWGVFWVNVDTASTAKSDYIAIANELVSPAEGVKEALQVLASTRENWLLVLDNADDPGIDYQAYIPSGTYGSILITSRVDETKRYSPDTTHALEGLEDEDAKTLLFRAALVPQDLWPSQDAEAQEVVDLLGSHTLAVIQAGAYIANRHCLLAEYPEVYQRQRKRLLTYRPKQACSRYHDWYATFEASTELLERSDDQVAKDALSLLPILSMLN